MVYFNTLTDKTKANQSGCRHPRTHVSMWLWLAPALHAPASPAHRDKWQGTPALSISQPRPTVSFHFQHQLSPCRYLVQKDFKDYRMGVELSIPSPRIGQMWSAACFVNEGLLAHGWAHSLLSCVW